MKAKQFSNVSEAAKEAARLFLIERMSLNEIGKLQGVDRKVVKNRVRDGRPFVAGGTQR